MRGCIEQERIKKKGKNLRRQLQYHLRSPLAPLLRSSAETRGRERRSSPKRLPSLSVARTTTSAAFRFSQPILNSLSVYFFWRNFFRDNPLTWTRVLGLVEEKYEASKQAGGAMAPGTERKASDLWRWRRWVLLSGTAPTLFPYWGLFVITLPTWGTSYVPM